MIVSLVGPNKYAKQRELRTMLGLNTQLRIEGEDGLSRWYEQLGQSDLFGQSPDLIAERVFEDLPKRDQEVLAEYLVSQGSMTSDQRIIFLIEDEKQLSKSRLGAVLAEQKMLRFPQPTPAKVSIWVQQEADRLGVKISKQLIPRLIEKVGIDQFALQTELERWALNRPAEITDSALLAIAPLADEADTFGLTTAWEQKNTAKALDLLSILRRQGTADQMIIGMLGWKIESLLLGDTQRLRPGKWTVARLESALEGLYGLDLAVKRGQVEPELGLELWLFETTTGM